jgi:hypothetical protein
MPEDLQDANRTQSDLPPDSDNAPQASAITA